MENNELQEEIKKALKPEIDALTDRVLKLTNPAPEKPEAEQEPEHSEAVQAWIDEKINPGLQGKSLEYEPKDHILKNNTALGGKDV